MFPWSICFYAMIKYPNKAMKEIFKEYGITRERFLQALSTVQRKPESGIAIIRRQLMIHWKNTVTIW